MPWLLLALSCKKVEPAPAELDDLLHWVWQKYDAGSDEELAEALVNLDAAVDGGGLEEAFDGTVTRLSSAEAEQVGVTDRDPALAPGVFLVNTFDCDFGLLEEILSFPDQSELYLDVYSAYARAFDSPRADWLGQGDPLLTYDISYTADLLGAVYEANSEGALRRVLEIDDEATPFGSFVIQRSFMPVPGAFEDDDGSKSMDQDYQLEIYWPRGPGRVVHAYGMWRQAAFGSGFDMEDEASQRILLNNLIDWDNDTATICTDGLP